MLYVGIDLGTYLCRFILAKEVVHNKQKSAIDRFEVLEYTTLIVNFGIMKPGRKVSRQIVERLERVFEKIMSYLSDLDDKNIKIRCVATAALRFSPTSEEIIQLLHKKFGINIEVISSKEEVYLSALGCQDYIQEEALVIDIGSGSTELAYVVKKQINGKNVVEIKDYVPLDLGLINNLTNAKKRDEELAKIDEFIKNYSHVPVICSKCNTLKIAHNYFHNKNDTWVDGVEFSVDDLAGAVNMFSGMDQQSLKTISAVGMRKIRLITHGLPWVYAIISKLGCKQFILSENGLKEGLILDMLDLR